MVRFLYAKGMKMVNRKEALEHFEDEYIVPAIIEMNDNIEEYINVHRKELTEAFVENFRELCIKIKTIRMKVGRVRLVI